MRFFVGLLAFAGVFMFMNRRVSDAGLPLGVRNNNPGNIENNGVQWQGLSDYQSGRFYRFETPEHGIRAMARIVRTYSTKYGINTVGGIISRWAPEVENDTGAYIEHVAGVMGVSPNETIDVFNDDVLSDLVQVIIKHENGIQPYDAKVIFSGVALA